MIRDFKQAYPNVVPSFDRCNAPAPLNGCEDQVNRSPPTKPAALGLVLSGHQSPRTDLLYRQQSQKGTDFTFNQVNKVSGH
jgi:hypothetical protein